MEADRNSKLIWKVVVPVFVIIVLITLFQLLEFEEEENEATDSIQSISEQQEKQPPFQEFADTDLEEEIEKEVFDTLARLDEPDPPQKKGPPSREEMPFAIPVPGNPLVVKLPGGNASLGEISVEKYDAEGNPTGQPLKRGTQVQIPDPNAPGGKIYFKVP